MRQYTPNLGTGFRKPAGPQPDKPGAYASLVTDDDLEAETKKRRAGLVFPLDVFPDRLKPLIAQLVENMHGERAFIGLSLLQCASAAIGSALRAQTPSRWQVCLSMWGATVGISSSGKSMIQGVLLRPLHKIQDEYNRLYLDECRAAAAENSDKFPNQKVLLFSDITFESLIKDVFGHNYKGVVRYEDELLKWLDDMDRYKTGKSEASFWTSAWSPSSSFSMRRAGNKFTYIDKNHLVASVMGSTQPDVLYRFYEQNRLQTGYIFRMLFAFAETDRVISPNLTYSLPEEVIEPYTTMIQRLHNELRMDWPDSEPQVVTMHVEGVKLFQEWQDKHTRQINRMESLTDRNVLGGIFGKIKEYVLRISLILAAMDWTFTYGTLGSVKGFGIKVEYVAASLRVCEYFMASGFEAYQVAKNKVMVPPSVLEFAALLKAYNYNQTEMARALNKSRQAVNRQLHDYMDKYPGAFGARNF
ncbi:DUF3987 domain-containing protein [Fibrella forsythiae]|uniref:DUF3987 domain-containing protein n=1 Tax=Fibrella forsythiae TaxID=2817061 RepID=A0ABS3JM46_9BACT|nr:DUF3987 domain-containing protein [Fibrella forsythiae]MBO0951080.1 DUF3987 domain-containing protein [Fibrella forsythiae]